MKHHHLTIRPDGGAGHPVLNLMCESRHEATVRVINHLITNSPALANSPSPSALTARELMREAVYASTAADSLERNNSGPAPAETYLDGMDDVLSSEGWIVRIDVIEGTNPAPPVRVVLPAPAVQPPAKHHHLMIANGHEILLNRLYPSRQELASDLIQRLFTEDPETGIEPEEVAATLREADTEAAAADYPEGQSFTAMSAEDYLDSLSDLLSAGGLTLFVDVLTVPRG